MLSVLRKLILKLIDKVFPHKCIICGAVSESRICGECVPKAPKITKFGDGLFYLYKYSGSVKKMIHALKFEKEKNIAKLFASKMDKAFFDNYDLVIPVPCHWFRTLHRGFFHVRELFGNVPHYKEGIAYRKRNTGVLFKKGRAERERTMKNVFKVRNGNGIMGKRILVVDDIYTSGTTYNEIKKELEKYSPSKVEGLFLCRA